MKQEHVIIIGNGPAANQAALTLREKAPDTRITIIGQERHGHYRPHMLPEYIAGKVLTDALYANPPAFYRTCGIKVRLGQEVVNVNFAKRELVLAHKEALSFSGLIIACGSRQRIPEPMHMFEDLFLTLKTLSDADAWMQRLEQAGSVMIVGGDLTSLSLARELISLGKKVIFMLNEESFWPIPLTAELSREIKKKLSERGVEVLDCRRITRLARVSDQFIEVETENKTCTVGILGGFFGLTPNVKFLVRSGLDIERGILVNEQLRTRFEHVYAAGDCAQVYHPGLRDYWVSIGYQNALTLGRVAAMNLLGGMHSVSVPAESIFCVDGIAVNTSWWTEF